MNVKYYINDITDSCSIDNGILISKEKVLLFADPSTMKTAISLFNENGTYLATILFSRKADSEDPVKFKIDIKQYLNKFMLQNNVSKIIYEDVYDNGRNNAAYQSLILIRDAFRELKYEYNVDVEDVKNTEWKARLVYPDKIHRDIDHKKLVRDYINKINQFNTMEIKEQDVYDSIGMGLAYFRVANRELPIKLLEKKKKVNTRFNITQEFVFVDPNNIDFDIANPELREYSLRKGVVNIDINKRLDVKTNIRVALENSEDTNDKRAILMHIPKVGYRYYGETLIANDLVEQHDKELLVIAKKKAWS